MINSEHFYIHPNYQSISEKLHFTLENFNNLGSTIQKNRNTIKKFFVERYSINIKSYKRPNPFNSFAYKYIRKSKAKRSYEYAQKLLELGVLTPNPIGYLEESNTLGIENSYYICDNLDHSITLKEVFAQKNSEIRTEIIKQYIDYLCDLHQKGILLLDNNSGNTLLTYGENNKYNFYLIDINRMLFQDKPLDFDQRMKNIALLTRKKKTLLLLSTLYAEKMSKSKLLVYNSILKYNTRSKMLFECKSQIKKVLKHAAFA